MSCDLTVPWSTHNPPIVGDPSTNLVHDSGCPEVLNLPEGALFDPALLEEARRMGFSQCEVCLPRASSKALPPGH